MLHVSATSTALTGLISSCQVQLHLRRPSRWRRRAGPEAAQRTVDRHVKDRQRRQDRDDGAHRQQDGRQRQASGPDPGPQVRPPSAHFVAPRRWSGECHSIIACTSAMEQLPRRRFLTFKLYYNRRVRPAFDDGRSLRSQQHMPARLRAAGVLQGRHGTGPVLLWHQGQGRSS